MWLSKNIDNGIYTKFTITFEEYDYIRKIPEV